MFKKLWKNYHSRLSKMDTLEERMLYLLAPMFCVGSAISVVFTFLQDLGITAIITAVSCVLVPPLVFTVFKKLKNSNMAYAIFCSSMLCITMPFALFGNGGLVSGMPMYFLSMLSFSLLCFDSKIRTWSFLLNLTVILGSFIYSFLHPELVKPMDSELVPYDIILCFTICAICMYVVNSAIVYEIKDIYKSRKVLDQVMDDRIKSQLLSAEDNASMLNRPGEKYKSVVMFADINHFTSFTERMEPELVVDYLNDFLSVAAECIHNNGGTIDKFIGDCVMAFWVDTDGSGSVVRNACQTFMDMQRVMRSKRNAMYNKYETELTFSAGIGYGESIVGFIGSKTRKDYTITGDAVNLAARLQDLSSKGYCYVSQSVYDIMHDAADIEQIPTKIVFKGKSKPMGIYLLRRMRDGDVSTPKSEKVNEDGYTLHICGCRGSNAVSGFEYNEFGGQTTCYLIKKGSYAIIIDCGSGLSNARPLLADCTRIDIIFSHVHYDHILGLLDWGIFPKNAKMRFFGSFSLWAGDKTLSDFMRPPFWPVDVIKGELFDVNRTDDYWLREDVKANFFKSTHPNECNLIVLTIQGKRLCIMTDCENPHDLPDSVIERAEMVLFDGMFNRKNYRQYVGWGHSTWEDGVELASKKNVGRMIIIHHDPHNDDTTLRLYEEQARRISSITTFGREGDIYLI